MTHKFLRFSDKAVVSLESNGKKKVLMSSIKYANGEERIFGPLNITTLRSNAHFLEMVKDDIEVETNGETSVRSEGQPGVN